MSITFALGACSASNRSPRIDQDFNADWAFHLEDTADATIASGLSTLTFNDPTFDDSGWQTLHVPHDWSIGLGFTQEEAGGATGYLPGGIGWYRKTFDSPNRVDGGRTWIEFDGVYNNAEVWLNGKRLGEHPYGYTPFAFDLTDHLNTDGKLNTLAVRVDRSAFLDSHWYPGSGIYRNVKLVTVGPIHIPRYGTTMSAHDANYEVMPDGSVLNKQRHQKEKAKRDWHKAKEHFDYEPGHMLVRGYAADGSITEHKLQSANKPARLQASVDQNVLTTNQTDIAHIEVKLIDAAGVPVRTDDRLIAFSVKEPARLLGVDNGSTSNILGYQRNDCPTHNGRVLLVVQATDKAGTIQITGRS